MWQDRSEIADALRTMMKALLATLVLSAACSKPSSSPASPGNTEAPAGSGSAAASWTSGHFEGQAAGGRGGTYWYDLCPDGSYAHNCLDAICDRGTWRREGGEIVLASTNPDRVGQITRLAIANDGHSFGSAANNGPFVHEGDPSCTE